ncbi:hypothetical protein BJ165DRAFT_1525013 [Panaeolus papilionaceus]|nr:hypothetical protein BJ165DRAFT_1525013 [Panaeolus papilionaceus]
MFAIPLTVILILLFSTKSVLSASITIDNTNPLIKYKPDSTSWRDVKPQNGTADAGGTHKFTDDEYAWAEIPFSYTSFSLVSALYPFTIGVHVYIDDIPHPTFVDLTDYKTSHVDSPSADTPASVPHQVVYKASNVEYGSHIIRIAMPNGQRFGVLDAIIFEIPDNSTSSLSPTSFGTPTSTPSNITHPEKKIHKTDTSTSKESDHSKNDNEATMDGMEAHQVRLVSKTASPAQATLPLQHTLDGATEPHPITLNS